MKATLILFLVFLICGVLVQEIIGGDEEVSKVIRAESNKHLTIICNIRIAKALITIAITMIIVVLQIVVRHLGNAEL